MFLQILASGYELVRRSPMAQTILELVVIKLATRDQWQSLEDISWRLEQALGEQPPAPAGRQLPAEVRAGSSAVQAMSPSRSEEPEPVPARASIESVGPQMHAPQDLTALWPTFLDRLGAHKMSLAAYLAESKPMHCEGGVLTIGLPAFALHQEVLAVLENRRLIERLLSDVCQAPVTVQYATLPEPVGPAAAAGASAAVEDPTPPIVQDIVKLFNATIVDRPPRAASP
jgi:hypothetical protein